MHICHFSFFMKFQKVRQLECFHLQQFFCPFSGSDEWATWLMYMFSTGRLPWPLYYCLQLSLERRSSKLIRPWRWLGFQNIALERNLLRLGIKTVHCSIRGLTQHTSRGLFFFMDNGFVFFFWKYILSSALTWIITMINWYTTINSLFDTETNNHPICLSLACHDTEKDYSLFVWS